MSRSPPPTTMRQILCPGCGQRMFLDRMMGEVERSAALIYMCASCHRTLTVQLDKPFNE